ncbi:retrovirus-related pol polyprotein from transposon TNT 1-94 [Tanacetum coccineum]
MSTDKESSAAGTDNRPPMLVESDYESWKIRIERYIRGKPLGKLIWRSIQKGPTPHPNHFGDRRSSQGLPRHVFNILNQTRTGKEIWDNVQLLMKGSGKSLQQQKEELFDEYKRFHAIGNESIHDYFVHFHKLINDMKITQLDIPTHADEHQDNKDISATTYVELYTYLKSYEPHAMKTLKKQEQSTSTVDPLAYLAQTTHYHAPTQTTTPPPPQYGPLTSSTPQQVPQSSNDAMLATMNQIVNLLSGFQKQFPPTNNQLRTSSNSRSHATVHDGQIITETVQRRAPGNVGNTGNRGTQNYGQMTDNVGKKVICYNCRGEGHVSRQCKEKKRVKDSQYFKDKMLLMEAKEKGTVLDAEAEAFLADVECTAPYDQPLAITTTNMFEVSHEDAYDSDVDEGPHAAAAFMANLSSTSGTNGATTSQVNEVHTDANQIFDNVNHLLTHEMHQEEHLDSDVESDIDDNTIPYHQYQLDSDVQDVPTEVSSAPPGEISMITILDDLRTQLDGHLKVNQEQSLVNDSLRAELARCKQEMLPAEELATQKSNPPKPVTSFVRTRPAKSQISTCLQGLNSWIPTFAHVINQRTDPCRYPSGSGEFKPVKSMFTEQIIPFYENVKQLVQKLDENTVIEVTEYMRIFDELDTEYEHCVPANKNLKIERKNLLIQNDCLIANCLEKDICSIVLTSDIVVPPSSNCLCEELRSNCDREHSKVIELEAEILKKQKMLNESEKCCAFIKKNHVNLQVKFQKYKECLQNQRVCDNSNSTASNAIFEINKLKDQLQGKDDTIRNLQTSYQQHENVE